VNILYGDSIVGIGDSIFISIVSMLIVFFVLILIASILSLLKFVPSGEEKIKKETKQVKSNSEIKSESTKKLSAEDIKDEKMLAAVSVAVMEAAGDTPDSYIRLKSIKELN
jgi:sodium pump decarboxylase gamma subunit